MATELRSAPVFTVGMTQEILEMAHFDIQNEDIEPHKPVIGT